LRRNHALFAQQMITRGRLTARAGFRYVHNESFGDKVVPQAAVSVVARQGGEKVGTTRFTFSYAQAIKEPRFEETFGISGTFPSNPNPDLRPEQNRAFEAGVSQGFAKGRHELAATYFNNLFRDQIQFDFLSNQYFNVSKSLAHGAEVEWRSRLSSKLSLTGAYVYTSTQVLSNPGGFSPFATGEPLLRRPRHSGSLLLNYSGRRWGGQLGGSFVGRRADSDFLFGAVPPVDHDPGYARVDLGGWYAITPHLTAYANLLNALDHHYEEVVGYPALKANFRAGMRFRFGGE
jgi:vitamin B12 transporter